MSNVNSSITGTNPAGTSTSIPITLTLNPTPSLSVQTENEIRSQILTTLQADYAQNGINVSIIPGSDYYRLATAIARWGTTIEANAVVAVDNFMPDSTQDFAVLARWMAFFGLAPRSASGAFGVVTITCSAPSPVNVGQQLTDSLQQVYQVTQAGTYATGTTIQVQALSLGSQTDHINGDVLTWVVAPPYASSTVTVGTLGANDGLVDGANAEDIETARARLLQHMATPSGGGNWAMVSALAAASSGAVCASGIYPGYNGPSTESVACWAYTSNLAASNAKSRMLPSALMTGTISPYITGNLAEFVECAVTSVQDYPVDVSVAITIPYSPSASPPGVGGGWVDATPWPSNTTAATNFYVSVSAVTSTTQITCNAPNAPIDGVSTVGYLDPSTWTLFQAIVTSHGGSTGAYTLVLSSPLVNVTVGAYLFPMAVNTQLYINAALGAFASLGPGEKTAAAGLLPRASRKPLPNYQFPYALNDLFLKAITNSSSEVAGTLFNYTTIPSWPTINTPPVPAANTSPPNIFVPRNFGMYPGTQ